MSKRKRVVLSLQDKINIIDSLKKGETGRKIAEKYGVGTSTISDIKKNTDSIMKFTCKLDSEDGSKHRKVMKKPKNVRLEDALYCWFLQKRSTGEPISGPLLCEKALELNKKLDGDESFVASNGWLYRFKSRHGIRELDIQGLNCRKRWKNLKDQCRKEMKKNSELKKTESEWPHFQKLNFIHHQFLAEDDEGDDDTTDEVFNSLDESIKTPKLGYTMRKKLLMNKRRTIDVDMNKLIDLVQARDIIWNRQLKGHHNWYKLDESWKEIAQELDVTRDEARLKWKYLRDQARKEVRKQNSEWEYLPKLQFLTNQFNDYEGNETIEDHYSQDYEPPENNPFKEESTSYYIVPNNETEVQNDEFDEFDTKPIIMETDFYDDDDEPQKTEPSTEVIPEPTKDEDIGFFNSLLPHVRKLGPAKKLMLRMKIQELVYNTVYNDS